jgi:hypothetical protein
MRSVSLLRGPVHLGMDVAKDAIAAGILAQDEQTPVMERIFHDEASIRRLATPTLIAEGLWWRAHQTRTLISHYRRRWDLPKDVRRQRP